MPPGHPEWLMRTLPGAEEIYLDDLAAQLWPEDEHAEIAAEDAATRRDDDDGDGGALCSA
jgi:hypothetical protein